MHTALRLALLYSHLLLAVFALHAVLSTDWRLLRSRISASQLLRTHRQVAALLAGLWLSGLAIVALDGWDQLAVNPKLQAKLLCVCLLTANGFLLRLWCFPRLISNRPLAGLEASLLMICGAISTTSWLVAGFLGMAKPLAYWSLTQNLLILAAALAVAVPVALSLRWRLQDGRLGRMPGTRRPGRTQPATLATLEVRHP